MHVASSHLVLITVRREGLVLLNVDFAFSWTETMELGVHCCRRRRAW